MIQHHWHKAFWRKIALVTISYGFLVQICTINASEPKSRKRRIHVAAAVTRQLRPRPVSCQDNHDTGNFFTPGQDFRTGSELPLSMVDTTAMPMPTSDTHYAEIMAYTKRQTDALIIESLRGHADYGIAHLEFLISLEKPCRVIHCATSKKILREYELLDSQGKIPQELRHACIWYKAQTATHAQLAHTNTG